MKMRLLVATAASLATLALASTANATSFTGWYGGIEAGANWVPDKTVPNDTIDPNWSGGFVDKAQFDTGWAVMGSAGYAFGAVRTELELGYRANDLNQFGASTDGGSVDQFTVMANALYDYNITPDYQLSVGGGLGWDLVNYDNSSGFHSVPIKDTDSAFAWQLMAGVSRFMPSINADVVLNYRYLQTDALTFTESDGTFMHDDNYNHLDNHTVTLGLRWH